MQVVSIPAERRAIANLQRLARLSEWPADDHLESRIEANAILDGLAEIDRLDHFAGVHRVGRTRPGDRARSLRPQHQAYLAALLWSAVRQAEPCAVVEDAVARALDRRAIQVRFPDEAGHKTRCRVPV